MNSHCATSWLCDFILFLIVASSSEALSPTSKAAHVLTEAISFVPQVVFGLIPPNTNSVTPVLCRYCVPPQCLCHLASLPTPTPYGCTPSLWGVGFGTDRTAFDLWLCHLIVAGTLVRLVSLVETNFLICRMGSVVPLGPRGCRKGSSQCTLILT